MRNYKWFWHLLKFYRVSYNINISFYIVKRSPLASQGRKFFGEPVGSTWTFAIAFGEIFAVVGSDINAGDYTATQVLTFGKQTNTSVIIGSVWINGQITSTYGTVIAIGRA